MRKLLRSPFGWAAIGAVTVIVPIAVLGLAGWPIALAGLCLYSIAGPVSCARGVHWWRDMVLTVVAWIAIFVTLGELPGTKEMRELATVFLLPMMLFPIAVVASGLIRAARWRQQRAEAPPVVQS